MSAALAGQRGREKNKKEREIKEGERGSDEAAIQPAALIRSRADTLNKEAGHADPVEV